MKALFLTAHNLNSMEFWTILRTENRAARKGHMQSLLSVLAARTYTDVYHPHRFWGSAALSSSWNELLTRAAAPEDLACAGGCASGLIHMTLAWVLRATANYMIFFLILLLFFLDFSLATVHKNSRFKVLHRGQHFHHIFTDKHLITLYSPSVRK